MMEHLKKLRESNIKETKRLIKESTGKDDLIIQAINSINEIKIVANKMSARLRLWYELYNPEFSRKIQDHSRFTELILKKDKQQLMKEIDAGESMGADLEKTDVDAILIIAEEISSLYSTIKKLEAYIEKTMQELCPNINSVAGSLIGAGLIEHAGSLKKLIEMPSSTVQLLGAEKALFRHLKTGAKCPKYGLILQHHIVSSVKDKAKAARMLADKISIAAKIDYFKGEFIGDKLIKEIEERFK